MISVHDAASRLGVKPVTVKYHCRRGNLKGERIDHGGRQGLVWLVESASIDDFLANARRCEPWDDADIEALLELALANLAPTHRSRLTWELPRNALAES